MELFAGPPLLAGVRPSWWRVADRAAAILYGLATAMLLAKHADSLLPIAAAVTGAVVVAWPIAGRRSHPLGAMALAVVAAAGLAIWQPRDAVAGLLSLGYVLYTVAAWCRPRTAVLGLVAALATAFATTLSDFGYGAGVKLGAPYIVIWAIGYAVGMHRRYTGELVRGQAQLARAEVDQARRELIEQRVTIAREVHDVVAHHMSVITVQAGYGGLLLDEAAAAGPGKSSTVDESATTRARDTLAVIETTGRQVLDEMRRLVGVLRADAVDDPESAGLAAAADLAPAPGLCELPHLLDQAAHAQVQVELTTTGRVRALPSGEDLAAYRIVQEALTNVIKHSGAEVARVHIDYGEDQLTMDIADDGPANGQRPALAGGTSHHGRGLSGMRERAQLYGGDLRAAPTQRGGFQVTAHLPLTAEPASRIPQ